MRGSFKKTYGGFIPKQRSSNLMQGDYAVRRIFGGGSRHVRVLDFQLMSYPVAAAGAFGPSVPTPVSTFCSHQRCFRSGVSKNAPKFSVIKLKEA